MGNNKRLIFEMNIIYDRLSEIREEYNNRLGPRSEPITDIIKNLNKGYIRIRFETYAYLLFVFKGAYIITWFRKKKNLNEEVTDDIYINDGAYTIPDATDSNRIAVVVRELDNRIFSGFSPRRGSTWYQYGLPNKKKRREGP